MKSVKETISSKLFQSKTSVPIEEQENHTCENCDHEFKGKFCPNCGQKVDEFDRPIGYILHFYLSHSFAFDNRTFKTLKYLIFKPGFITLEFFKGRRIRYISPFQILMVLSFIFFLLLQILSEQSLKEISRKDSPEVSTIEADSIHTSLSDILTDSLPISPGKEEIKKLDSLSEKQDTSTRADSGSGVALTLTGNLRDDLNKMANEYELKLIDETSPKEQEKIRSKITMCRNPEILIPKILKLLSWAFFALVPVLALILKLTYIRHKQRYIKHLIFSTHTQSYLFIVLIIIAGYALLFNSGTSVISTILLLTIPVYQIIALKKFYGGSYIKTIGKFMVISFFYMITLFIAVIAVIIKTFL
ncbi:MAG TPA: DUF3667 domain-containing protein [Prolixibacteraceae bacterium]|nr:DUF3667 domain-containing protein [Prolixibacteraceae bacterium]HPS13140.1 DUF3667 domain-containing protein [Prolixibacteraceae bacterium]